MNMCHMLYNQFIYDVIGLPDPETLRQSMEMARNPALRDEMNRVQVPYLRPAFSVFDGVHAMRHVWGMPALI